MLVFFQVTFKLGRVRRVGGWQDTVLVRRKNRALRWDCLHAYLLGDRLLLIPQSPACLLLRKLEGEGLKYFAEMRKFTDNRRAILWA